MKTFQSILISFLVLFAAISSSLGAEFLAKQTGTTTIANTSTIATVAITDVDMSKSFLIFSSTSDNASPTDFHVGGEITNSTTLTFERTGNNGTVSISWQVFEFESGVYVQRGSIGVPLSTNVDVSINCIDLTKSFAIVTGRKSGTTLGNDDGLTADLNSTTNLRLLTGTAGGNYEEAYWQVIEYQASVVKKVTASLTSGNASTTSTVSPAITNLSKAFVISSHIIGGNSDSDDMPRTELTNTTTVTYTRVGTAQDMDFITYVIEFTDGSTVSTGLTNFPSTSTSQNVLITASASSGFIGSGNYGRQGSTDFALDDNIGHVWFTYEITSGTNLLIQRATGTTGGNSSADAPWQIVTFEDTGLQQQTFYSRLAGPTDWESNLAWSFTPDGSSGAVPTGVYPRRTNNVVIQSGHEITINNVNDNGPCSQSPQDLGRPNVAAATPTGPFTGSTDQMFYHTGDMLIATGGILTSSEEVMLEGYTLLESGSTFTITEDIVNLGYMEIAATANFDNTDDLILSGNSITIMNNTSTSDDDLYIDDTDATLCGEGVMNIGTGGPDPTIQYWNGATIAQVCAGFSVECADTTPPCPVGFPMAGTGPFSSGNSGPGGVGSTSATGDVRLWLAANTINQTDGSNVAAWTDRSGYGNDASAAGGNEPVFDSVNPALNGFPSVQFTAANMDYMSVPDDPSLDPVTVSAFVVGNHSSISDNGAGYLTKFLTNSADGYMITRNSNSNDVSFIIDGSPNTASTSTGAYDANAIITGVYDKTDLEIFKNGTSEGTDNNTSDITANTNSLYLGATPDGPGVGVEAFLDGDIAEAVVFGRVVNNIERILARNYLSAKYALVITDDVYTMDDNANGDYDFEVAGIGQTSTDGSSHRDARGIGLVRMWNPTDLDNDEYLMWGHDNGGLTNSADVDGTVIEERLTRIWRVSETADVGTVSISFDLNGVGNPLGSNLRLLIDRDDDFTTNDVTPIVGTVSGNVVVFSNVNFSDTDRFTLGNTDASSPLPVELALFNAKPFGSKVQIEWSTASELKNDFFTIQKSKDGEHWHEVLTVKGAGTSQKSNHYHVLDYDPIVGLSYYRLKQTDFDGNFDYSQIVSVRVESNVALRVFPNPSNGTFRITGDQFEPENIKIYNSLGQLVQTNIRFDNSELLVDLIGLPNGIYIMKLAHGSALHSVRLVKN